MSDSLLNILGLGAALAAIFGVWIVYTVYKLMFDDPSFEFPDIPEIDSIEQEGWELVYTDEDSDYGMLAQVYKSKLEKKYRVILSNTEFGGGVQWDEVLDSYSEAEGWAKDWLNSYNEDAS